MMAATESSLTLVAMVTGMYFLKLLVFRRYRIPYSCAVDAPESRIPVLFDAMIDFALTPDAEHLLTLIEKDRVTDLPMLSKEDAAGALLDRLFAILQDKRKEKL